MQQWLNRLGDPGAHDEAFGTIEHLHRVERGGSPRGAATPELRVVAWNLERGRHLEEAADILRRERADVVLATELDIGMARSGNRHTPAELAGRLGHEYVFGLEFFELGLGSPEEREHAGEHRNAVGHHGNAILSALPLHDPVMIRIERDGRWFRADSPEPRIGGRVAVAAVVETSFGPLGLCSVHLESESDPRLRTRQFDAVLDALRTYLGDLPAVIGGDLNTFTTTLDEVRSDYSRLHAEDPNRWVWPPPHEPLFDRALAHGFEFDSANLAEQTVRFRTDQEPGTLLRLDWLLVRGVRSSAPQTIPAIGREATVLSDHDAVAVTVHGT